MAARANAFSADLEVFLCTAYIYFVFVALLYHFRFASSVKLANAFSADFVVCLCTACIYFSFVFLLYYFSFASYVKLIYVHFYFLFQGGIGKRCFCINLYDFVQSLLAVNKHTVQHNCKRPGYKSRVGHVRMLTVTLG